LPIDRVLGAAVRALQRDTAESQRRADLNDRPAIARLHALQCRAGPVDEADVGRHGDALVLFGSHVVEERDRAGERVMQLDRAELVLDGLRSPFHRLVVGDIGRAG
jgi:hypothetical protein